MTSTPQLEVPSSTQSQRPQQPPQQRRPPTQSGTLTFDEISKLFSLPIAEAAPILGVCTSALKRICREYGIARWPYRKFLAGKTLEDIKRDVAKERTKELTNLSKTVNQTNSISNVVSTQSDSLSTLTTNPAQSSSQMQRVPVPSPVSQLQGNKFAQNGWSNTLPPNQLKDMHIPTFMDEFKHGFPTNGLSTTSIKWWGVGGEEVARTLTGETTIENDENQEAEESSNEGEELDSGEDNVSETKPSALLCSLRRKSVEYGRESLKRGISVACVSSKISKKQKLMLARIFGTYYC